MRRSSLVLTAFLLTGCYVNSDGCLVLPQSVSCFHSRTNYPHLARFQKPESIGHTGSAQRWKDAVACGAEYGDENLNWSFRKNFDLNGEINGEKKENFMVCMKEHKKYITFSTAECGYQEESEGKCNL